MYDCLVPMLKDQIPFPQIVEPDSKVQDLGVQINFYRKKQALENQEITDLKEKVSMLQI